MEDINVRFKKLRESCHKTQEQWGKIIGLSRSGISEIESGRRNVTDKHIKLLLSYTEYPINEKWLRHGGDDDDMYKPDFQVDELADYCADITEGKDPFIADMLLKYKRLSPKHKQAIWEIYEELTAEKKED